MASFKKKIYLLVAIMHVTVLTKGQYVDIPPNNKENYRAQEGGSSKVNIDKATSLESLLKRLESNWQFLETGKVYWIGYTDDMFSIAAYKDNAIKPLLDFYDSTRTSQGKIGAIYCLHLIGIDSKIVGRFVEKFINKNARNALLSLTSDTTYLPVIINLLARDPWESDLPILSKLLKTKFDLYLTNALFRYTSDDFPFRQDVKENLDTINIYLQDLDGLLKIGILKTVYREMSREFPGTVNAMRNVVTQLNDRRNRIVRRFILDPSAVQKIQRHFSCDENQLNTSSCETLNDLLYSLIFLSKVKVDVFSYSGSDENFHHYVRNNDIIICTAEASRLRWLEYFRLKNY